jgi:hypothetical protein
MDALDSNLIPIQLFLVYTWYFDVNINSIKQ